MRRHAKKWALVLACGIILALATWRSWPKWLLLRDQSPEGAAAAFILMGSVPDRTVKAYELLRTEQVPRLIFVQDQRDRLEDLGYCLNGGEATQDYLKRLGADASKLEYLSGRAHTSTREEAETLVALARQRGWPRVAVVTSWYHTARAGWIFEKVAGGHPEIVTVAATDDENQPEDWWRHERAFLSVFNEYLKWLFYLVTY